MSKRCSFELYKSNVCHAVKRMGDLGFVVHTLETSEIRLLYNRHWYAESLYLLAMVDYLSRLNDVPICTDYQDIRMQKLKQVIYPSSILALCAAENSDDWKRKSLEESIPEFRRFNIVENEIRNVY